MNFGVLERPGSDFIEYTNHVGSVGRALDLGSNGCLVRVSPLAESLCCVRE